MAELLKLTDDNYFSLEADRQYMSVSQFKSFMPQYHGCEATAVAKQKGNFKQEESIALLVGSYFHSHFEGSLSTFKQEHSEIFTKQGTLKSEYKQANEMINYLETDEAFKKIYVGDKEKIFTFNLFGIPWKIKVDLLNLDDGYFVDLKTTKDFEKIWIYDGFLKKNKQVTFPIAWGYLIQIAIYREGLKQVTGLKDLDGFIIAVTKQKPPDKTILGFREEDYELGLAEVERNIKHVLDVKNGVIEPERCGKCAYCRSTKKLDVVTHYSEL